MLWLPVASQCPTFQRGQAPAITPKGCFAPRNNQAQMSEENEKAGLDLPWEEPSVISECFKTVSPMQNPCAAAYRCSLI